MLKLNDVRLPSFVKVNKVSFSILPTLENNLMKIRGKDGYYNLGQSVGDRKITVSITIVANRINGVAEASRYVAEWLYHKEPVKLYLDDEPDKYYMVLPDGDTQLDEIVNVGQGDIAFICTEPFAFGADKVFQFTDAGETPVIVDNQGTAAAYPMIQLTVKDSITSMLVVSEDAYVQIGDDRQVSQTPVNTKPSRLTEDMSTPSTWTTATSVDDGVIAGSFSSNGYSFKQSGDNFGTGTGWHGASAVKALDAVITNDFEVTARFGFHATKGKQIGRVELYLLDENNVQFAKIGMQDANPDAAHQRFIARAGIKTNGYMVANDWGDYRGVWSGMQEGKFTFSRTGNKWYAQVGILDQKTGLLHTRKTKTWVDTKGLAKHKLAKIQIHIAAYGTYEPITTMYFQDISVVERLTFTPEQVPIIARKGDVLTIDNEKAVIYKNGDVFYEGLNPSSSFIKLKKGANGLSVLPNADMRVQFTERWL